MSGPERGTAGDGEMTRVGDLVSRVTYSSKITGVDDSVVTR